jgi:hypothetical protein
MNMDELLAHCGFDSAFEMIKFYLDELELDDLLSELIADDQSGLVKDICEEIAKEHFDWIDRDKIQAERDDAQLQAWKDRGL